MTGALLAILLVAASGCSRKAESPQNGTDSKAATAVPAKSTAATAAPSTQARKATHREPAAASTRVRLTAKGCVEFVPTWASIRVGQSLTWRSELKSPVVIHVSAGAFDKVEFVAQPGASVTTGPARAPGSFWIWTNPAACQGAPRGVQSSGPGVTVKS